MKHIFNKAGGFRLTVWSDYIISIEKGKNGTVLALIGMNGYELRLYDYRDTDTRIIGVDDI